METINVDQVTETIHQESIDLLEKKMGILKEAIHLIERRNINLKSFKGWNNQMQLSQTHFKAPDENMMNEYFQSRSRLLRAEKRHERLVNADHQLNQRIEVAKRLLAEKREAAKSKYIALLSPTAAQFISQKYNKNQSNNQTIVGQSLEILNLKSQIEAINAIKSGEEPKPRGALSMDFDSVLYEEKEKLKSVLEQKKQNLKEFEENIQKYLNVSYCFSKFVNSHSLFAQAFANFEAEYQSATNVIEAKPLISLLSYVKNEIDHKTQEHMDFVLQTLDNEKAMITELFDTFGIESDDISSIKKEIDIKLLYLKHLTAVAEKTLCKFSARKEPIDPLDIIEVEISELQQTPK